LAPEVRGESSKNEGAETRLLHAGAVSDGCLLHSDNHEGVLILKYFKNKFSANRKEVAATVVPLMQESVFLPNKKQLLITRLQNVA
jgi:hypothetical protein